jgi:Mg2+ and Co2+ transporter CorA
VRWHFAFLHVRYFLFRGDFMTFNHRPIVETIKKRFAERKELQKQSVPVSHDRLKYAIINGRMKYPDGTVVIGMRLEAPEEQQP